MITKEDIQGIDNMTPHWGWRKFMKELLKERDQALKERDSVQEHFDKMTLQRDAYREVAIKEHQFNCESGAVCIKEIDEDAQKIMAGRGCDHKQDTHGGCMCDCHQVMK